MTDFVQRSPLVETVNALIVLYEKNPTLERRDELVNVIRTVLDCFDAMQPSSEAANG